ncbi:MAG: hypothetical protein EA426_06475 [Spirochaetaceae bacterium]|nr:MAG: hypothetical protein EA426_06475 [Spirochaetaceae bacterium]
MEPVRPPNCLQCVHFSVSWDRTHPRACAVFGVKSRELPSIVVFRATGRHCPSFVLSEKIRHNTPIQQE